MHGNGWGAGQRRWSYRDRIHGHCFYRGGVCLWRDLFFAAIKIHDANLAAIYEQGRKLLALVGIERQIQRKRHVSEGQRAELLEETGSSSAIIRRGRRSISTSSRIRSASARLCISGRSIDVLAVRNVTALRSESKPMPLRPTSFSTMASAPFLASFPRACSTACSVSAANPITSVSGFRI